MKGIIYKAENLFNGLSYIGQTRRSLSARIEQHFYEASLKGSVNSFHTALLRYGRDGFEWSILDEFEGTKEEIIHALNVAEEYHILKHRTLLDDRGYNSTKGGYSSHVFAEAIRRRAKKSGKYKPILQYDLAGNFLREFESLSSARKEMGYTGRNCFVGRIWKGYQWVEKTSDIFPRKIEAYRGRKYIETKDIPVLQYNKRGELLREFPSISAAKRASGISEACIRKWCNTAPPFSAKHARTAFIWQYKRGEIIDKLDMCGIKRKTYHDKEENKVVQMDNHGNEIKVWKNMYQASLRTGDPYGLIRKQCLGIPTKKRTEFMWKYFLPKQNISA